MPIAAKPIPPPLECKYMTMKDIVRFCHIS